MSHAATLSYKVNISVSQIYTKFINRYSFKNIAQDTTSHKVEFKINLMRGKVSLFLSRSVVLSLQNINFNRNK